LYYATIKLDLGLRLFISSESFISSIFCSNFLLTLPENLSTAVLWVFNFLELDLFVIWFREKFQVCILKALWRYSLNLFYRRFFCHWRSHIYFFQTITVSSVTGTAIVILSDFTVSWVTGAAIGIFSEPFIFTSDTGDVMGMLFRFLFPPKNVTCKLKILANSKVIVWFHVYLCKDIVCYDLISNDHLFTKYKIYANSRNVSRR